ncbi:MAG: hypothetical protein ACFB4I_13490 [Cyanophyceae cyanobacterium]
MSRRPKSSVEKPLSSTVSQHDFSAATPVGKQAKLEIGQRSDFEAVVEGGLAEGQVVILHPSEQIREGVKLRNSSVGKMP